MPKQKNKFEDSNYQLLKIRGTYSIAHKALLNNSKKYRIDNSD